MSSPGPSCEEITASPGGRPVLRGLTDRRSTLAIRPEHVGLDRAADRRGVVLEAADAGDHATKERAR